MILALLQEGVRNLTERTIISKYFALFKPKSVNLQERLWCWLAFSVEMFSESGLGVGYCCLQA